MAYRGVGGHGDGGGQRMRRRSKAAGAIARQRQIISTADTVDGEGGNRGAGVNNQTNCICMFYY